MALEHDLTQRLAGELYDAEISRRQVRQFSLRYPHISIEDAYAIQSAWVRMKIRDGRRLVGHKIGLTSRAMQRSSNIDEPDYGALLDDMLFQDGDAIPAARFIVPRIEVELAFVLKERLSGPDCTLEQVFAATEYVTPAIEIIDARIQQVDPDTGATRKVFDTISDNAANAGVVLGGRRFLPDEVDMRWISALLYKNDVIEDSGVAAAVLGHPAIGVAWLANKLHHHGLSLEPGQIILGGSFTAPLAAAAGDRFRVDYGPVGAIAFTFV